MFATRSTRIEFGLIEHEGVFLMDLTYMLDKVTNEKVSLYSLIFASAIFIPYQTDWVIWNTITAISFVVVGILSSVSTIYRYMKRKNKKEKYLVLSISESIGILLYVASYIVFYKHFMTNGLNLLFCLFSVLFLIPFIFEIVINRKL